MEEEKEEMPSIETATPVTLITGCSRGLGYALAEEFASKGHNLFLVARDEKNLLAAKENLAKKYGVKVFILSSDLAEASAAENVFGFAKSHDLLVDVLINNAGQGTYGEFADSYIEDNEAIVQIDVVSLLNLTYLFLHGMKDRKSGTIINVSSTAAYQPGPLMAVFYASKTFVLSFSESLRREAEDYGVNVSCLLPANLKTDFIKNAGMGEANLFSRLKPLEPAKVARECYKHCYEKNKPSYIPGAKNRFLALLNHFISADFASKLMKKRTRGAK